MFTGIIECAAAVNSVQTTVTGGRLVLRGVPFAAELARGESVAVNGCCLTVTSAGTDGAVTFDLLAETLRVTNLGALEPGSLVNLERALRAGDRLSGHFVQGHIDTTAEVIDFSPQGQDHRLEITLDAAFQKNIIPRGSIAIDGISLTIAEVNPSSLVCWIIPHTAAITNLSSRKPGHRVNVEFDIIGKYVHRHVEGDRRGDGSDQ
jgi:riboflavin synthase